MLATISSSLWGLYLDYLVPGPSVDLLDCVFLASVRLEFRGWPTWNSTNPPLLYVLSGHSV
jgi:hypothetical protein